jgi:hypothetical protein
MLAPGIGMGLSTLKREDRAPNATGAARRPARNYWPEERMIEIRWDLPWPLML